MKAFSTARAFSFAITLAALISALPLRAQLGDRAGGDPQNPPSPDLEIPPAPVLPPDQALKTFVLPPGFRIEIVATEPLVRDPVMITFDPRGRMWVAELPAYNISEIVEKLPVYLDGKSPPERPKGRVVVLEDTDGDGRMDRRTVYWDDMDVPRAIGFVRDQVLIGDPPNLWITRDVNGDGVMDEKTLLDTNYGTPSNVEGSPNGLLWGRDNWLYNASYGWRWRFDANGNWQKEPMPRGGQWGITQDDFGRRFHNSNSDQLRGDFVPSHYAGALDPRIPLYGVRFQVATDQSTWPIRPTPGVNRGYMKDQLKDDGSLNTFTAASAAVIYRGANFPSNFRGNAFVPGPDGHLIKRNLLLEAEGRITAMNAYLNAEFVSSTDERFRPVFLTNAPDGALYVVDYYRGMLEGYEFITTYLRNQILQRGLHRPLWGHGRIYRIVHEDGRLAKTPDFAHANSAALVTHLTDQNGWTRDTAQRLIVESGARDLPPLLRELMTRATQPQHRVSALWCLEGLRVLTPADVERGFSDDDARVRAAAVQAAAPMFRDPSAEKLLAAITAKAVLDEPMVVAQLALALAGFEHPIARSFLWSAVPRAAEHPSLVDAVLIALRGHETEVLQKVRERIVAGGGLTFGSLALLETLGLHLVIAGPAAGDALAGAIMDKQIPQLGRIALMRGAIKVRGPGMTEKMLAKLASDAPDGWVRRRAAQGNAAAATRRSRNAARPPVQPLTEEQTAMFSAGSTTFGLCAACHQPDGLGRPDLAPSLKDGRWANAISPDAAIRIVLHGKQGTAGFPAPMPGVANLSDEQVAGVLTFVRRSFGNMSSAVSPADIARIRREAGERSAPWTDLELESISP